MLSESEWNLFHNSYNFLIFILIADVMIMFYYMTARHRYFKIQNSIFFSSTTNFRETSKKGGEKMNISQKIGTGLVSAAIVVASFAMPAFAANNGNGTDHIGPLAGASDDGGTCGLPWAHDTYNLFFTIHNNGDGTFAVKTEYKDGSFITIGTTSPGACETTDSHHGSTVTPGINGNFQGYVDGTVTSSIYNPNACNTPGVCTTRTTAIAAIFGCPSASCYDITSFNFEYNSS